MNSMKIKEVRWLYGKSHLMECTKCRFMPDTVCDAHYRDIIAEIDKDGNCSGFRYSLRKIIKLYFKDLFSLIDEALIEYNKSVEEYLNKNNKKSD